MTDITVNCDSSSSVHLDVVPGAQIRFYVSPECLELLHVGNSSEFGTFVSSISQINTGGSALADWLTEPPSVLYTAGASSGTDSIDLARWTPPDRLAYRFLTLPAYYMTVPGAGAGPTPWPQAIGRAGEDATCPVTYGPSWAQWPNDNTGGWVCVREYYYDPSVGEWGYRKG